MKRILYLLVLSCCIAACKKSEEAVTTLRFSKIEFRNETKLSQSPYILYDGKMKGINASFAVSYGEKAFTIYKKSGEKLLDTTLSVTGHQVYYIIQPDTTKPVMLSTTAPPPPVIPPIKGPLDGVTAAPEGFIKFKIKKVADGALPFTKLDVVINMAIKAADGKLISTPLATLKNVGGGFGRSFYEVKRGDDGGLPARTYQFSFINPNTGEPIMNSKGEIYKTDIVILNKEAFNLFLFELYDYPVTDDEGKTNSIVVDGTHYKVDVDILDKK